MFVEGVGRFRSGLGLVLTFLMNVSLAKTDFLHAWPLALELISADAPLRYDSISKRAVECDAVWRKACYIMTPPGMIHRAILPTEALFPGKSFQERKHAIATRQFHFYSTSTPLLRAHSAHT